MPPVDLTTGSPYCASAGRSESNPRRPNLPANCPRAPGTVASVVSKFVYDGWNTAQEKDSKNKIAFNELDGLSLDQVFSRAPASGSGSYLLTDALGSAVGLADNSGVVGTSYTYEPYGNTTVSGASSTNPFGFTGRENDSTGNLALYNYRARRGPTRLLSSGF
jgi:hypothetical protein